MWEIHNMVPSQSEMERTQKEQLAWLKISRSQLWIQISLWYIYENIKNTSHIYLWEYEIRVNSKSSKLGQEYRS